MVTDGGLRLSLEERNLFSVAIGNVIESKRSAARIILRRETGFGAAPLPPAASSADAAVAQKTYAQIKATADGICAEWLRMIEALLAPSERVAEHSEAEHRSRSVAEAVFYLNMRANAYRCLAEFSDGVERAEYQGRAMQAYAEADEREALMAGGCGGCPIASS